jgi:protein-L-isoaspartate(D-aspartate) O-methyltransferase
MDPIDSDTQLAQRMVDRHLRGKGIADEAVLEAMSCIPRHRFIPHVRPGEAYDDKALPTAQGQTISQPYMVARMTALLRVEPGCKVLEIGTGSGYQTAILARMGAAVVSIDRLGGLTDSARAALTELGLMGRVKLVTGDGTLGYPPDAPYDRILVTAGAPTLPGSYVRQLAEGGRIVIPIGDRANQVLKCFVREGRDWREFDDVPCRFVPLVGEQGWRPVEEAQDEPGD